MPVTGFFEMVLHDPEGERRTFRMRRIDSSNVEMVGWPMTGEPFLLVQFKGGARYGYLGVSRQRAVAAANHPSTGKYINERIKPHFKVVRIR